jgi:hypothetical protein
MQLEERLQLVEDLATRVEGGARHISQAARAVVKTARTGELVTLRASCSRLDDAVRELARLADEISAAESWSDTEEQDYLASAYVEELRSFAEDAGISLNPYGTGWSAFPVVVRVDAKGRTLKIDRKRTKAIRPSVVIGEILRSRHAKPRLGPEQFIEVLRSGYDAAAAARNVSSGQSSDGMVRVVAVYEMLTLLPDARRDYPIEEFTRDLHQLQLSGVRTSRDGRELRLSAAGAIRSGKDVITVIDDEGTPHHYFAMAFQEASA